MSDASTGANVGRFADRIWATRNDLKQGLYGDGSTLCQTLVYDAATTPGTRNESSAVLLLHVHGERALFGMFSGLLEASRVLGTVRLGS